MAGAAAVAAALLARPRRADAASAKKICDSFREDWGIHNVKCYGAVGNGVNDDSRAIQAAIDAAEAAGGGIVFLPPGIYRTTALTIKAAVTLHLDGGVTILTSDGITMVGGHGDVGSPAIRGTSMDHSLIHFTGAAGSAVLIQDIPHGGVLNPVIEDVQISNQGAASTDPMVDVVDSLTCVFRRVRVRETGGGGGGSWIFRLTRTIDSVFEQVVVSGNINRDGILLRKDTNTCEIRDCRINGTSVAGSVGIQLEDACTGNRIVNTETSRWGVGVFIGANTEGAPVRLTVIDGCYSENCITAFYRIGFAKDGVDSVPPIHTTVKYCYLYNALANVIGVWGNLGDHVKVEHIVAPQPGVGAHFLAIAQMDAGVTNYDVGKCTADDGSPLYIFNGKAALPACRAFNNAGGLNPADGVPTAIPLESKSWDTGGMHDNAVNNSRITPGRKGRYQVMAILGFLVNATGYRQLQIVKNGSVNAIFPPAHAITPAASGVQTYLSVGLEVEMNGTTDYLEMWGTQRSGRPLDIASAQIVCRMMEEIP